MINYDLDIYQTALLRLSQRRLIFLRTCFNHAYTQKFMLIHTDRLLPKKKSHYQELLWYNVSKTHRYLKFHLWGLCSQIFVAQHWCCVDDLVKGKMTPNDRNYTELRGSNRVGAVFLANSQRLVFHCLFKFLFLLLWCSWCL